MSKVDILIDTYILLWLVNGSSELTTQKMEIITKAQLCDSKVLVATISIWEIALLASKNRIALNTTIYQWTKDMSLISNIRIVGNNIDIECKSC